LNLGLIYSPNYKFISSFKVVRVVWINRSSFTADQSQAYNFQVDAVSDKTAVKIEADMFRATKIILIVVGVLFGSVCLICAVCICFPSFAASTNAEKVGE